jgi:GNAT superfamily N-acetyltransferase
MEIKTKQDVIDFVKGKHLKIYENNEPYLKLKERAIDFAGKVDTLEVSYEDISTATDYMIYKSEGTLIEYKDARAYIRFKSRAKSVDISRVWIAPENQKKGLGTLLMTTFLFFVQETTKDLGYFPKIICECSGTVGGNKNRQETPVEVQLKFFMKFGFELNRIDDFGYHHMILNQEKMMEFLDSVGK